MKLALINDLKVRDWISSAKIVGWNGDVDWLYDFSVILYVCNNVKEVSINCYLI